jgi:branched-chain amino acid transport system substrate-binding protein
VKVLSKVIAAALLLSPWMAHAETIKLGLSGPMTGAGATWGLLAEYTAKQAAAEINKSGGVTVDGKNYTFEVVAYDNKYTASEGAKVGQALINRDGVRYIVFALGMAPVRALQAISEKQSAILFTTGAGKSIKGPQFPFTFTELNTPFERYYPLFEFIKQEKPQIKSVVIVEPNDATGQDAAEVSKAVWAKLGVKVLDVNYYERGTTEFSPLATRIVAQGPDIIDFSEMPPVDVGLVLAGVAEQGWKGEKVWSSGSAASDLLKSAGTAAEGTYMALAGDFGGPAAPEVQRRLDQGSLKDMGEHMNAVSISAWDATMAIRAAMLKANSVDPAKVRDALPDVAFESSYGLSAFGGKDEYGSPQQILLPIIISQLRNGAVVELARKVPAELQAKLNASKKQ